MSASPSATLASMVGNDRCTRCALTTMDSSRRGCPDLLAGDLLTGDLLSGDLLSGDLEALLASAPASVLRVRPNANSAIEA